jgi:hypothetical protein
MIMFQDLGPTGIRFNAYLPADRRTTYAVETTSHAQRPSSTFP